MSRKPRKLEAGYCYHITIRCNNREFRLTKLECRQVLIYAIKKAIDKYNFRMYGLCLMSNHIHYLIEPLQPSDLPKIMHWLNWYTALCFNQMLNRTGHFWEKRYHSTGFAMSDKKRALNTLRYIHGNPKAAGIQQGMFYDFSNYGVHERLGSDGVTTWHPAFLALGKTLDECASIYKGFCQKYRPQPKKVEKNRWGSKLLAGMKPNQKKKGTSPGQLKLFWDELDITNEEIIKAATIFVKANCYTPNPKN
ncbi:transposase [Cylindrospermopsis raciborskii]|nr:transposase [Cylindrospermopsis raciborskii]